MNKVIALVAAASLVLLSAGRAQEAVDFSLQDLQGTTWTLSAENKERVVLLSFWATWCLPCLKEMPKLQALLAKYEDQGLALAAISVDGPESLAMVRQFAKRYNWTFPVLLDSDSRVLGLYNPKIVLPFTVLVAKGGRIAYVHQGYSPGDEVALEQKVVEALSPAGTPAESRPVSFQGTNSLLVRHFTEPGRKGGPAGAAATWILDQFDFTAGHKDILLGGRFDGNLFLSPSDGSFTLAKRFIEARAGAFRFRGGDFYKSLGRGLVFSLLKIFETESLEYVIDTTVDGAAVSFSRGNVAVEVFGGWIERRPSETSDRVLAGTVGWQPGRSVGLHVNVVHARLEPGSLFGTREATLASLSLELPRLGTQLQAAGELALMRRYSHFAQEPENGAGLYVQAGYSAGNTHIQLEWKDYLRWNFEYSRPPLLESEQLDILADQFDSDTTDVSGLSARIDHYFASRRLLAFAKALYMDDSPENHALAGAYTRRIVHLFGGLEKRFAGQGYVSLLLGIRDEEASSAHFYETEGRTVHHQENVSLPLGGRFSLEADWKFKRLEGPDLRYSEHRAFLSLHSSPRAVLSILWEHTDNPRVLFFRRQRDFWACQLEVKFGQGSAVRMFYGATKGTTKCAGGVCQVLPPFEGLRVDAVIRF